MRWLLDEDLPRYVVDWLIERGDDVLDVAVSVHRGSPDHVLWRIAGAEERFVLTGDLGFMWPALQPLPVGVVIVRAPSHWQALQLSELIRVALQDETQESLHGMVTLIEPGRVRRRSLHDMRQRFPRGS